MKHKLLSLLAAAAVTLSAMPFPAMPAAADEKPGTAYCGEELHWSYDESARTLTISGSGLMYDYCYANEVPWYDNRLEIQHIVLPEGLMSIGMNAFRECNQVSEIDIPASCAYIFSHAFDTCASLLRVSLPESLVEIGAFAFSDCWPLHEITLPDSLTEIGQSAFANCEGISAIRLPDSLERLGTGAFCGCAALESVTIPAQITEIPDNAFMSCLRLETVHMHEGVTAIGEGAFSGTAIASPDLPAGVTRIGKFAFEETPWIAAQREISPLVAVNGILIDARSCTGDVTAEGDFTAIGEGAFCGCSEVTGVTVSDRVTSIGQEAFSCCFNLQSVTIPDSVTEIGRGAFSSCLALEQITLPAGLTVLHGETFAYCSHLHEIGLPDSLKMIGHHAFDGCTEMDSITIRNPFCAIDTDAQTLPVFAEIWGFRDSFAESYARINQRTFREITEAAPGVHFSFEIIPLLPPFNQYFLVRTDHPDPRAFRFVDQASAYTTAPAVIRYTETAFADVQYDDPEALCVGGGYIFESLETDGGDVILQFNIAEPGEPAQWYDFGSPRTLPALCDGTDYLISTYAPDADADFFDRMDAVQKGFSSVCLYSGCDIRGELYRTAEYWRVARAQHPDQLYYIYSPYDRKNNGQLLATHLYPFRYDSVGFPEKMGLIARRLNRDASWKWSDTNHSRIAVTYDGHTRTYGGQGGTEGQGITKEMLTRFFTLDDTDIAEISLESLMRLQKQYAAAEMPDDIPRQGAVTWAGIAGAAGRRGTWAQIGGFTYFYKADDRGYAAYDTWGAGNSVYFSGSLGYYKDTWIDGRYIGSRQMWEPGARLAEHPTADIVRFDVTIPVLDCTRDPDGGIVSCTVTETQADVRYRLAADGTHTAESSVFTAVGASLAELRTLTEQGLLDEQYLDALVLTPAAVQALRVDRNTDTAPADYLIYDGSAPPGTAVSGGETLLRGDVDENGTVNIADAVLLTRFLAEDREITVGAAGKRSAELDGKDGLTADDGAVLLQMLANLL